MKIRIYTLQKTLFEGEVIETIAKTTTGEIAILAHHEPLITMLVPSNLRIKKEGGGEEIIRVEGGFLEVMTG